MRCTGLEALCNFTLVPCFDISSDGEFAMSEHWRPVVRDVGGNIGGDNNRTCSYRSCKNLQEDNGIEEHLVELAFT